MNIQSTKNSRSHSNNAARSAFGAAALVWLLSTLTGACSIADDSSEDDGIFDDDDLQMRTCNDYGGFLEVNVSGAIEASFDSSAELSCQSIGGFEPEIRGVALAPTFEDDRGWSFHVRGPLELGVTIDDVPVEVFLFTNTNTSTNEGEGAKNESWSGDCRFDISTFELFDDTSDWHDYRLGGSVRCDEPLEPFIGPEEAITVSAFNLVGIHTDITTD